MSFWDKNWPQMGIILFNYDPHDFDMQEFIKVWYVPPLLDNQ